MIKSNFHVIFFTLIDRNIGVRKNGYFDFELFLKISLNLISRNFQILQKKLIFLNFPAQILFKIQNQNDRYF